MIAWIASLVLAAMPAQDAGSAPAFEAWLRGYLGGKADWDEAVLRPLLDRGSSRDGARILRVLAARRDGPVRDRLLAALATPGCPIGIQGALLRRIRDGVRLAAGAAGDPGWDHDEPGLVAGWLPLLGAWDRRRFRWILERFCRGGDPELVRAAATTLARTGGIAQGDRRLVLDLALRRLQDRSAGPRAKEAWLPLTREIRDRRTVPVLIGELGRARTRIAGHAATPTELSFYVAALHEALLDLTGFWAPASSPERWSAFWEREQKGFRVRPKAAGRGGGPTAAGGFFGIPVRGRRVLFIVDTSGSMQQPAPGGGTRLARAKRELAAAVAAMDPEAEFNVILFSDRVTRFTRAYGPPTPARLGALGKLLARFGAGGATNLADALRSGIAGRIRRTQTRSRRSIDEVFVLSDGAPRTDPARILRDVARWNPGRVARIHAVYLGDGDDAMSGAGRIPHGRSLGPVGFMRQLAQQNGGVFLARD